MRRLIAVVVLLAAALPAGPAAAAEVPANAEHFEAYFPTTGGDTLHADVLRPKGLPRTARTPVILTVSPYTGHSGSTIAEFDPTGSGPSDRFADLLAGGKVLERGYTYVMVELRGFGASTGCNDWGGPREQADVKAAVEWAAAQPWSTGRVALYGKSYDGWTGLMGLVQQPRGLAAVVSMEPVYDGYRYLYTDGVRFINSVSTPALFQLSDAASLNAGSGAQYALGSAVSDPACLVQNLVDQQDDQPQSPFWKARELISRAKDARAPLFLTQGFLEDNTKPDGAFAFFGAVPSPKRAWFGMFDHIRPSDTDDSGKRPLMGRDPRIWWDEVMRFLDHHVREVPLADAPTDRDAAVVVGSSDGTWRSEERWPPADARQLPSQLLGGEYADDGANDGTGSGAGNGLWTISPPLGHRAHLAGVPRLTVDVSAAPRANLVAGVYDIDRRGMATLVSRGAKLLRAGGLQDVEMYGDDWVFEAGHRVGVLLSPANAEWWQHVPTQTTVTVAGARVALPFLRYVRAADQPGRAPDKLTSFRAAAPFQVPADVIAARTSPAFALPEPLAPRPAAAASAPPTKATGRLRARIAARGRRVTVYGSAPSGSRVRVVLRRGARIVARRTVRARLNAFRVRIRVRRAGRYRATVTARADGATLRARTPLKRVR